MSLHEGNRGAHVWSDTDCHTGAVCLRSPAAKRYPGRSFKARQKRPLGNRPLLCFSERWKGPWDHVDEFRFRDWLRGGYWGWPFFSEWPGMVAVYCIWDRKLDSGGATSSRDLFSASTPKIHATVLAQIIRTAAKTYPATTESS